jgi:hypothetical protein
MSYPVGPGVKQTISQRGWFTKLTGFTACRFATGAQCLVRTGVQVPLARQPKGVDNFVYDLQLAGDNTPKNGSSLGQLQKGIAKLVPDAQILFGRMTDAEMFSAVQKGATVGFVANFARLTPALREAFFCGRGFVGGHAMAIDAVYDDGTVDVSTPMYKPAAQAKPVRVAYSAIKNAIERDGQGNLIVWLGYQDAAYLRDQLATAQAALAAEEVTVGRLQAAVTNLQGKIAALG